MKTPANGAAVTTIIGNPAEGVVAAGAGGGGGGGGGTGPGPGPEKKSNINQELWQACAGPLVNLPAAGTHVLYFPQGHSEQVAASMKKDVDSQIPNYPNLPSKLLCILHNVTLHADTETDEVYAQMTLQPVPSFDKDALLRSDLTLKSNKPQTEFFCKTLTASDTSTHGGFSVPRRAAEKIFPPLDFSMQPPAQELVARDLHDTLWTFRHIFRGQPKRHLLTTGWSLFVSGKRLLAGDSVLFIRDEKQQLLLGIRRANRQSTNISSSVLSSDSMHIGILAAAAHAAANNSPFTVFYNPRASPSEFVIPLAKYYKSVYSNQISLGMRFRMMFETEESGTRRYMGTITGITDIDPVRWKNSQWRNLQVGWDESTAGERRNQVSIWEIEPVTAPFFICPPPFFRSKRPRQPGMPDDDSSDMDSLFKRTMPWLGDDICMKDPQALPGLSLVQWMNMQQNPSLANSIQSNYMQSLSGSVLQNLAGSDLSRQLGLSTPQIHPPNNLQFNVQRMPPQAQQLDQLPKLPTSLNPLGAVIPQQQLGEISQQSRQKSITQTLTSNQIQAQNLHPQTVVQTNNGVQQHPQTVVQTNNGVQQQSTIQSQLLPRNFPQGLQQQQQIQHQHILGHNQQGLLQSQLPDQINQPLPVSDNQVQLQLLQKLQHQQQLLLAQQSTLQQPSQVPQLQDHNRQLLDASQSFSKSMTSNQMLELPQTASTAHPPSNIIQQQLPKSANITNARFSHSTRQPNLQPQQPNMLTEIPGLVGLLPSSTVNQLATAGNSILNAAAAAGQSGITDDIPSCSTSPSTNNCPAVIQPLMNSRSHQGMVMGDDMAHSATTLLSPNVLENVSSNANLIQDMQQKFDVKPSLAISKNQNQGNLPPQAYINGAATQTDYLDVSSSATSVCILQNDIHLQQNKNSSYNIQSLLLRDTCRDGEPRADPRHNVPYGTDFNSQPMNSDPLLMKGMVGVSKDMSNNLSSGSMLVNCENSKDPQQELSSSMVSQSFGVPDMAFNSIDSAINESSFLNGGSWAPPPQFQRMRTYTKVYKRGAVGRSIDITRYSGYEELKQDLARRFGIEGQLEDGQRIGWKLVYVDHEDDVLLVGDDPWEEFVNCVRCIKILSPQEVQQMSLEGHLGNPVLPNQACSSSDNGNA